MEAFLELLKVYKDFGVAALFLALLLVVVKVFYGDLKSTKQEYVVLLERTITVIEKATSAIEESNGASREKKDGMDQLRAQNSELISFLRGRDEHRRTGR